MTISRDSWLWWLGLAGALVAFLSQMPPPTQWAYSDWVQLAAMLLAWLTGKLATSPLAGEHDAAKVTLPKGSGVLVLLLLPALLAGCAPSFKAKLEQADRSVMGALQAVDTTEQTLFEQGQVDAAFHKAFSAKLVTALTAGQTFHRSVATYTPGQQVPLDVVNLSAALTSAADLVRSLPPSDAKARIAAVLDAAALIARDLLVLVLPKAQAAALFPVPVYAH